MKYHSNTKTVLIVLLITLLFFLSSFFLLFTLNLTSPTLIVTDYLMKKFSSVDSDISFSFESMERNFRDRVMIHNLTVSYKGGETAFFETVEVKLGLFDMISYFLDLEGSAEVDFRSGTVKLDPFMNTDQDDSSGSSEPQITTTQKSDAPYEAGEGSDEVSASVEEEKITPSRFLSSHSINITFTDVCLTAGDGISGEVEKLELSYTGEEKKLLGEITLPEISLSISNNTVNLTDTSLSFTFGDTIFLRGGVGSVSFSGDGLSASADGISVSASAASVEDITSGILSAVVSIEEVRGETGAVSLKLEESEIIWKDREICADASSLELLSGAKEAEVKTITASLSSFDDYTVSFSTLEIGESGSLLSGDGFVIKGSLGEKKLGYAFSSAAADAGEKTKNHLGTVTLSSVGGSVDYSDGVDMTLSLSAVLGTPNETVDDITFGLDGHIVLRDGSLSSSTLNIRDLYLGYGEKYDSSFSITGDLDNARIRFDYGVFNVDLAASVNNRTLKGDITVEGLELGSIVPLFSDEDISLFDGDSLLSLDASVDLSYDSSLSGRVDYSLEVGKLKMSFIETRLGSMGTLEFLPDRILLSRVTLETSFFSLDADGYWDLVEKLPTLDFSCTIPNGTEVLSGYIHLSESSKTYEYYAALPSLQDTFISGDVDFSALYEVKSASVLMTNAGERPFRVTVDLEEKTVSVTSERLSLEFDYAVGFSGSLRADSLETLHSPSGVPITLDGALDFSFSLENGFEVSSDTIVVSDIFVLPSSPTLSFSFNGKDTLFNLDDITIRSSESGIVYTGRASADLEKNILAFSTEEEGGEGRIVFSLYKDDGFVAALRAESVNLNFLGLEDMYASLSLFGRAARIEDFSFDGNISVVSPTLESEKINADITINGSSLTVENVVYSSDSMTSRLEKLSFDSESGKLLLEGGSLNIQNDKAAGAMPVNLSFSLSGETAPSDSLFSTAVELVKSRGNGTVLRFDFSSLDINSQFIVTDRFLSVSVGKNDITLSGNFLTGSYSLSGKTASISVDLENIVRARVLAELGDDIEANVTIDLFNMALVNLIMKYPTVVFRDDLVHGEVSFTRIDGSSSLDGYLTAEELGVDVFWIEDQSLILHNPRFVIWNNDLRCSLTYTTVYDKLTSERRMIRMDVGVTMNESLSIESWDCDVYMDENNPVRVRIPLHLIGVDILGYVTGHYYVKSDENGMLNEGELYLSNTDVTIGMNPFPEWYRNIKGGALMDLTFHIENNNRVLYPAGDEPIVSIMLQEDSSVYAYKDNSSFYCSGNVDIRGGEIYYFQKYFYITSGSLSFDDPTSFNPRINLRATLRDYDSSSEKVEIYLVMKDNTFDNLSPTLESSPTKDLSEIMEILGQSILSSDTYGSMSVSSVASLVTEGFDILSRLGIVTTGSNPLSSLSSSLKSVFGVDTFSLHSNILNNIVTDTINQATQSGVGTYSPMARFLSGTTLNIGKYLSQNLYLQIMVHLEARKGSDSYTIISDDLALDTEISLEWANSAFTVTFFTRPSYFSFYSILSTFGFSISKTINF